MATTILDHYLTAAKNVLESIASREAASLETAAAAVADAYQAGHRIYIFGCTHSAILAEDVFYRAGAPAFWQPLWGPGMNIATTPGFLTSAMERCEEAGRAIVENSQLQAGDVLLVISTSGKNAAPVAVAATALQRQASVIVISSSAYREARGNHSTIGSLWQLVDRVIMIDNHVPCGDAAIEAGNCPMGPLSTLAGSFLVHSLSALAVEQLAGRGIMPPVFLSSNAPGGREHNEALLNLPGMREKFMLP